MIIEEPDLPFLGDNFHVDHNGHKYVLLTPCDFIDGIKWRTIKSFLSREEALCRLDDARKHAPNIPYKLCYVCWNIEEVEP